MPNHVNRKYCALFDAYAAWAAYAYTTNNVVTILLLFSFQLGSFAPLNFLHSVYLCCEARISVQKRILPFHNSKNHEFTKQVYQLCVCVWQWQWQNTNFHFDGCGPPLQQHNTQLMRIYYTATIYVCVCVLYGLWCRTFCNVHTHRFNIDTVVALSLFCFGYLYFVFAYDVVYIYCMEFTAMNDKWKFHRRKHQKPTNAAHLSVFHCLCLCFCNFSSIYNFRYNLNFQNNTLI